MYSHALLSANVRTHPDLVGQAWFSYACGPPISRLEHQALAHDLHVATQKSTTLMSNAAEKQIIMLAGASPGAVIASMLADTTTHLRCHQPR